MDRSKSSTVRKASSVEQASVHSKSTTTQRQRINVRRVQNVLLIWLDNNIDDNNADCRNTIIRLRQTVNDINTFTDDEECLQFIDSITDNKACMIISGSFGRIIVPKVHNMSQVDSIFIFCGNKKYHEQWTKDWPKIKGVFTEISPICEALKQVAQQCEQNAISISFVATGGDVSKKNLNQLDPIFMYSQILKEILLTIEFDDGHIKEFIDYCHDVFVGNNEELKNVMKLQTTYRTKTPIWWYTYECFLYPMLNRALRLMDIDIIIKMGFFVNDLHRHIEQLHSEQLNSDQFNQIFTVYRGQGMSTTDFNKMTKIQGGLMSFNNFLSTSKDRDTSLNFARHVLPNSDMVGILFVMTIDPTKSITPFASIADVGYYGDQEHEVLFSMHTIFRIDEITCMSENQRLFQVNLTLTSDNDKDFRALTDHIRKESDPNEKGWYRLGLLLLKVGESVKAQQVFEILLEQTTNVNEKGRIFHLLGTVKYNLGEYKESLKFYEKAMDVYKNIHPFTHLILANCYNDIGNVYSNMNDYPKALSSYEKALEIQKQTLPSNHSDLGMSYNNIGAAYDSMNDYPKALSYYEKALEIKQQSLPLNHPDLGGSYNNIGTVYDSMGNYSKALSYYEKALEIKQQSLPSNHPSLSMSYNNIGIAYENMGDYPKARSFFEQAVIIGQHSLPSNHPDLQDYRNSLDRVKNKR